MFIGSTGGSEQRKADIQESIGKGRCCLGCYLLLPEAKPVLINNAGKEGADLQVRQGPVNLSKVCDPLAATASVSCGMRLPVAPEKMHIEGSSAERGSCVDEGIAPARNAVRLTLLAIDELDPSRIALTSRRACDPSHDPPAIERPFTELHHLALLQGRIRDQAYAGIADILKFSGEELNAAASLLRQGQKGNDVTGRNARMPAPVIGKKTLQYFIGLRNNATVPKRRSIIPVETTGGPSGLDYIEGCGQEYW